MRLCSLVLASAFVVLVVQRVEAQSHVALGVEFGYGWSQYTTGMPAGGLRTTFPDTRGPTYVPVSVTSQVRLGDSAGMHWLVSGALGIQVASINTSTPVDRLPYINHDDGSILYANVDAQLAMVRRSTVLSIGVGGEVAGFEAQVLGRMAYVYAAESTHLLTTEHRFYVDPRPPAEVRDGG